MVQDFITLAKAPESYNHENIRALSVDSWWILCDVPRKFYISKNQSIALFIIDRWYEVNRDEQILSFLDRQDIHVVLHTLALDAVNSVQLIAILKFSNVF